MISVLLVQNGYTAITLCSLKHVRHTLVHCFLQVGIHAAYLYDAVAIVVGAVDKVLRSNGDVTNGTAILERIIGHKYTSEKRT